MRLRCARASLRSSGVTAERGRLRGGSVDACLPDEPAVDEEGEAGRLREEEGREREEGSTKPACCCCVVEAIVPRRPVIRRHQTNEDIR
jgi:hypothetical protein